MPPPGMQVAHQVALVTLLGKEAVGMEEELLVPQILERAVGMDGGQLVGLWGNLGLQQELEVIQIWNLRLMS